MDRQSADRALAGLGAAYDRIAAAMYAVDSHPGLGFLRGARLGGETAARWRTLKPEVDLLWAHFGVLGDLLDRARSIRGQRRPDDAEWTELTLLLEDPVVAVDATGLPVESSRTAPVARLRLWELAQQLEPRCAGVAGHLSEVDAAWSGVAARLAPLIETLDGLAAAVADLGDGGQVRRLEQRLTRCREDYLADPLAAAPGGRLSPAAETVVRELSGQLDVERQRLSGLTRLRDEYPQRIAAVRALIDEVAVAERGVADGYARARLKIADPGLPPLPDSAPVLRARLAELDAGRRGGGWAGLADRLAAVEQMVRRARQHAAELRDAADGLLSRRDELRGRLEAYRAKAGGTGFAEDEELSRRYDTAHELLYTAPCDLPAATRAVFAYQQALASLIEASDSERKSL